MNPLLTICMAVYDDYDGVYFTAQSIRLHHPEVTELTEILVIDNHPDGPCAQELAALQNWIPGYRYLPWSRSSGTAVRDIGFREARGEYVLCLDSHVLLVPGALCKLLDYFQTHPGTADLLQGPLLYDDLRCMSTHMEPRWSNGMFGVWGTDPRAEDPAAEPFEIAMQGLGLFACRRAAWPGFNPRLRGFGSEEGYIHEKFRRAGGRTLCLPFLRWLHRFGRPHGVRYRNEWEDRIRNYTIVARELRQDTDPMRQHFRDYIGHEVADRLHASAVEQLDNPFTWFDAVYCINLDTETERWQRAGERFEKLGIASLVRRFPAIPTPANPQVGCALSHRAVIEEAHRHGLKNVLVFEDDVVFTGDAPDLLKAAIHELESRDWSLFYPGACKWEHEFPLAEGCRYLEQAGPVTTCHAIAYSSSVYERLLSEIPADTAEAGAWIGRHLGIDQYYASRITGGKLLMNPQIATQEGLIPYEPESLRYRLSA